jgi:hypothetical protein
MTSGISIETAEGTRHFGRKLRDWASSGLDLGSFGPQLRETNPRLTSLSKRDPLLVGDLPRGRADKVAKILDLKLGADGGLSGAYSRHLKDKDLPKMCVVEDEVLSSVHIHAGVLDGLEFKSCSMNGFMLKGCDVRNFTVGKGCSGIGVHLNDTHFENADFRGFKDMRYGEIQGSFLVIPLNLEALI